MEKQFVQCLRFFIFGIGSYNVWADSDAIHELPFNCRSVAYRRTQIPQSCNDHFELKNPPTHLHANNVTSHALVYLLQRMQESQLAVPSKLLLICLVNAGKIGRIPTFASDR